MKKSLMTLFIGIGLLFGGLVSCGGTTEPICATSISLDKTSTTLIYNGSESEKSITLHATVEPSNYNYGTISWSGGKSYDDTYVSLTPSADGKSCVLTGLKETEAINVYAKINGKDKELTATCVVKVTHASKHITTLDFTESTLEKTIALGETVSLPFYQNTTMSDDQVYVTFTSTGTKAFTAGILNSNVVVTGVWAGESRIKLQAYFEGEATGVESREYIIHVSEPETLNMEEGTTTKNDVTLRSTAISEYSYFKIVFKTNLTVSLSSPIEVKLTPLGSSEVDLTNFKVTIGVIEYNTLPWIILGYQNSDAIYNSKDSYTFNSEKTYYVKIQNACSVSNVNVSIHVTLPAA